MIGKGAPWGRPASGPPDREVHGSDAALAEWVAAAPGGLVRFVPAADSDLARAVGVRAGGEPGGTEVPMDALVLADGSWAVNAVVLGTPPDRCSRWSRRHLLRVRVDGRDVFEGRGTGVVVATGQWVHGVDVVPRGHPGDGRVEVQVYRLRPAERRPMRARLAAGAHVPHPRIVQTTGRTVEVVAPRPLALEVDGRPRPPVARFEARVHPAAYRLLV